MFVPNLCLFQKDPLFSKKSVGKFPEISPNCPKSLGKFHHQQHPPGSDRLPAGPDAGSAGSSEVETSAPSEAQLAAFRLREEQLLSELLESRKEVEHLGMVRLKMGKKGKDLEIEMWFWEGVSCFFGWRLLFSDSVNCTSIAHTWRILCGNFC